MGERNVAAITPSFLLAAVATGCTERSPAQPTAGVGNLQSVSGNTLGAAASAPVPTGSPYGGHGVPLIEVSGSVPAGATGILNDTQTGEPGFDNFEVTVSVHGGPPDTDLYLQFVGDIVPATRGDGICPAPFPAPPANTIRILHTSAGGTVTAHVKFEVPEGAALGAFDSGERADFKWRVVNLAQTFDLQTPCVVLTGK